MDNFFANCCVKQLSANLQIQVGQGGQGFTVWQGGLEFVLPVYEMQCDIFQSPLKHIRSHDLMWYFELSPHNAFCLPKFSVFASFYAFSNYDPHTDYFPAIPSAQCMLF